ncbi:MAG: GNAT family N-acetyltransferase [Candidatus Zixiibacteriota bacterium]
MNVTINPINDHDLGWVKQVWLAWGGEFVVTRGRKVLPDQCRGFCAIDDSGKRAGLVTYQISGSQCEVITLDTMVRFGGVGTALMSAVESAARESGCRRLWFITTNDNLDAIRFYQRRGYTIAAVHLDAIAESRKLKPSISLVGNYGIPIRDEIEFEKWL